MKKVALLIILLLIGLSACKEPEPKYGKEFNEERKKIGLPTIPDNWKLEKVREDYSLWVNPERSEKFNARIPVHRSKSVWYPEGSLVLEEDIYYGINDYTILDGTYREKLLITYYYQVDERDYRQKLGWDILLSQSQDMHGKEISLEEAEKILKEWGIERLSYEFPLQD